MPGLSPTALCSSSTAASSASACSRSDVRRAAAPLGPKPERPARGEPLARPLPAFCRPGRPRPPPPRSPARLRREILLRMLLNYPFLVSEASEEIASVDFPEPELDRLRREILQVETSLPGLDASGLRQHLE